MLHAFKIEPKYLRALMIEFYNSTRGMRATEIVVRIEAYDAGSPDLMARHKMLVEPKLRTTLQLKPFDPIPSHALDAAARTSFGQAKENKRAEFFDLLKSHVREIRTTAARQPFTAGALAKPISEETVRLHKYLRENLASIITYLDDRQRRETIIADYTPRKILLPPPDPLSMNALMRDFYSANPTARELFPDLIAAAPSPAITPSADKSAFSPRERFFSYLRGFLEHALYMMEQNRPTATLPNVQKHFMAAVQADANNGAHDPTVKVWLTNLLATLGDTPVRDLIIRNYSPAAMDAQSRAVTTPEITLAAAPLPPAGDGTTVPPPAPLH